ncbi:MAG: hypothetical protein IKB10_01220 [Alphaproteobacteria bacterium]|nr:hypothetical protein [Alphaproteobacteria bacterium]
MNKFLKLTGVSMLAIMTASGANAAGYTCEELIEYTSCNAGYYLTDSGSLCPEGSTYGTGYCGWTDSDPEIDVSEEDCTGTGVSYIAEVCYEFEDTGAMVVVAEPNHATANTCSECPAGSYCPAGSESPTPCPAGSYCAGTKLGAVSGVCAIGSYSLAGATACSTCPASGLTDANGNVVSVTTASTGSTSSSACFVAKETEFKDSKGTYKYTDNCAFGNFNERADCEAAEDAEWADEGTTGTCYCTGDYPFWNYDREDGIAGCSDANYVSKKSYCEVDYGGTWVWDYENFTGICDCPDDQEWIEDSDESGYCE